MNASRSSRRLALTILAAPFISLAAKKPIRFSGLIESIDYRLRTVAVQHGDIPGFLPAMTMDYPIDDKSLLRHLVPGDEIEAVVYVGSPVLHNVHVTGHRPASKH